MSTSFWPGWHCLMGVRTSVQKLRNKKLAVHRPIGKMYAIAVLLSSIVGFYISFFATGGIIASFGFGCLAIVWYYTTMKTHLYIRNKELQQHQRMMIYSYAACFAAATLRIWLPLLNAA